MLFGRDDDRNCDRCNRQGELLNLWKSDDQNSDVHDQE